MKGAAASIALLLVATGLAGCGEDETFAYVNVAVTIDNQTIPELRRIVIASCDFEVRGVESEMRDLRCLEGVTPYDLGTFRWATAADRGIIQFFVVVYDANRMRMGEGATPEITLSPGAHLDAEVKVVAVAAP